jgi:hypothetical protein
MTQRPKFSRRRIHVAHQRSLKLGLLQYQGRDLPMKFLLGSSLPLVQLELRRVAFRFENFGFSLMVRLLILA